MNERMIRTMVVPAVLAGVLLCVVAAGGCSKNDRQAKSRGGRSTEEKGQIPYYYGLVEEYKNVLAEDPHNLAALIALGNAYYDAAQWTLAVQNYEKALQLNPHLADVVADMGTCFRNLGLPDRAIVQYEKALKVEPTHQNALFNLGLVYGYDRKDYRRAIAYWEQLLHVAPKHPQVEYLQATMAEFRKAMKRKTN